MSIKLMRKYSKPLMAFFGVILMITFLVGISYTASMGTSSAGFVVGKLDGHPLTNGQLTRVQIDVNVLRRIPYFADRLGWLSGRSLSRASLQFYLLLHEATRNGFLANVQDVRDQLQSKTVLRQVATLLENSVYVRENVVQAVADLDAINQLANFAYGATLPSEPQLLHYISELSSKVRIDYVRLSAAHIAASQPAPSAAMLAHLFTTYRGVLPWNPNQSREPPRIDGHHYPFGYRYPNRVKLEFMKFDRAAVRATMQPTLEDVQTAYRYYKAHRNKFVIKPQKTTTTAPAHPQYKTFEQVKNILIRRQLDRHIDILFHRMTDWTLHQTAKVWKKPDISGFYTPLPRSRWLSYHRLSLALANRFHYRPEIGRWDHWLDAAGLASLRGIGQAVTKQSGWNKPLGLRTLALKIHELDPHAKGIGLLLHLQAGREGPVLEDQHGNEYIYRITAVSPAHDPTSLSQVRTAVIRDARLLEAYQLNIRRGRRLAEKARKISLAALAKTKGLSLITPPAFTALAPDVERPLGYNYLGEPIFRIAPAQIPGIRGRLGQLTRAAFKLARENQRIQDHSSRTRATDASVSPASGTKAGKTAHVGAPEPAVEKPTTSVNIGSRLDVFVMQLVGVHPIPVNMLDSPVLQRYAGSQIVTQTYMRFLSNWLSYKAVAAREHFVANR